MKRLIILAMLLSACVPASPAADPRVQAAAMDEADRLNAIAATQAQEAYNRATQAALTATALPPQQTGTAQVIQLQDIAITQAWDNATATISARQTMTVETQMALVATNNEGARRSMDAQKIYNEQQAAKEFDAKFWPIFWRVFWIAFAVSTLVVGVWVGQAFSFRVRADSYAKEVAAQGEADAKKIKASAEAREIRARAKRWEMIQTRDGIYIPDGSGQYKFVEMTRLLAPMPDTIPPVPSLPKIGAVKVYTPMVASVLDFLDRCAEIAGPDAVKLPSAEEINNSTLRNAGLIPLSEAGLVSTSQGRGRGTFILGYKSISDLRGAVESGLAPLPESVSVSAN